MKPYTIIPTYNEKDNIVPLVEKISALGIRANIIIVDDNSPDGTEEIADKLARRYKKVSVIHRKKKMGLGSAYKAGFRQAFKESADVVLTMDADLSHNPKSIPDMLKKIGKYDVVIGSRHNGGQIRGFSFWRHSLSGLAQALCRLVLGIRVHDSTSGFRAYRADVLKAIKPYSIKSEGYSYLIEAIFRVQQRGFSIAEAPIVFEARQKGKSKLSEAEIYKALWTVARLRLPTPGVGTY